MAVNTPLPRLLLLLLLLLLPRVSLPFQPSLGLHWGGMGGNAQEREAVVQARSKGKEKEEEEQKKKRRVRWQPRW